MIDYHPPRIFPKKTFRYLFHHSNPQHPLHYLIHSIPTILIFFPMQSQSLTSTQPQIKKPSSSPPPPPSSSPHTPTTNNSPTSPQTHSAIGLFTNTHSHIWQNHQIRLLPRFTLIHTRYVHHPHQGYPFHSQISPQLTPRQHPTLLRPVASPVPNRIQWFNTNRSALGQVYHGHFATRGELF